MKCPQCGRDLPYGSKYCLFCNIHVDNDEIPTVSEPTKVIPTIAEKPQKPKLKPEKKRQLILFYGSIGAIGILFIILFAVVLKSCSKPENDVPTFTSSVTSEDTSTEATASVESTLSLPQYNSVNVSSAESVSEEVSSEEVSSVTSSETVSEVTVLPGSSYLSFTVADLKKTFGEIASRDDNEGEGSILSFADCKYKFIVDSAAPQNSDRVNSIIVTNGGEIISGAKVGQTYNEIFNSFGKLSFSYDEVEEIAVATTSLNNATYYIYFEKEDKNSPSLSALIKLN